MKQNLARGHKDDFIDNYPFLCCFIWINAVVDYFCQSCVN